MSHRTQTTGSPLWRTAVNQFQEGLQENSDYEDVTELGSIADLLNQADTFDPTESLSAQ